VREIHRVGVPVEKEDVIRINGVDGGMNAAVPVQELNVCRIGGFIERVVSRDNGIIA
jgi:hypothetical protein